MIQSEKEKRVTCRNEKNKRITSKNEINNWRLFLIKNARSGSYLIIEYEDDAIYKAEELEKEEKLRPSWCECGAELTDEDLQDWSSRSKKSFFCEACCVEQAREEEKGKKRKYNDPASKYWM